MITLLIVDDHPIVRSGLAALLAAEDDIDIVGEAGNGADAVAAALALRPSATLMDLRMPDVDGVEAIARIKAEWPDAAIVVLTTYDTDEAIVRAIEAGASGYLLKDAPPETLLDAVRRAAAGETVLAPPVARRLIERVRNPAAGALSRTRDRSPPRSRHRPHQRPDRGPTPHQPGNGQDTLAAHLRQTRRCRPGSSGRARLRLEHPHPTQQLNPVMIQTPDRAPLSNQRQACEH